MIHGCGIYTWPDGRAYEGQHLGDFEDFAQKPWSKMSTICITETPGLQKYFFYFLVSSRVWLAEVIHGSLFFLTGQFQKISNDSSCFFLGITLSYEALIIFSSGRGMPMTARLAMASSLGRTAGGRRMLDGPTTDPQGALGE